MSYFDEALPQPLPLQRITPFHSDTLGLSADIQTLWSTNTAMYQYIQQLTIYLKDQEQLRILQELAITDLQMRVAALEAVVVP